MNVMYISYDGMTDPLGQSQVIPYLCGLSKEGYAICLISCEKQDRYAKTGEYIRTLLKENNIEWFPVPYSSSSGIFSKQLNLKTLQKEALNVYHEKKPVLVHCRSYMAAIIGLKLKRQFGIKFIFDMRGFWADERIDGGIWRLDNFIHKRLYKYFKKKEIEFLKHADYTISLTENAKTEIESWKGIKKHLNIEVIPCCVDLQLFSPLNINNDHLVKIKNELNISSQDFILSYLGSIGTWYMIDEMLDFFKILLNTKPKAKFLFITGDDKNIILEKAQQKGISEKQIIIRSAERKEVPLYLSLSSVCLYFIRPVYSKKASSPTKTGEIMGMGIPLITNTGIGDSDLIIQRSKAGILINEFTTAEYNRAIKEIDVLLNVDKNKITRAANDHFSLQKGIELYSAVYKKTLINK